MRDYTMKEKAKITAGVIQQRIRRRRLESSVLCVGVSCSVPAAKTGGQKVARFAKFRLMGQEP
jgi:hypothetical protein